MSPREPDPPDRDARTAPGWLRGRTTPAPAPPPPVQAATAAPDSYRWIIGRMLRFWAVLLLLVLIVALPLLLPIARRAHASGISGLMRAAQLSLADPLYILLVCAELAAALAAVRLVLRTSRLTWAEAGFAGPVGIVRPGGPVRSGVVPRLALGSAIGMASFSVMPLLSGVCGWVHLVPAAAGVRPWEALLLAIAALLPSAAFGEIILRGPPLALLARRSPAMAVVATTLCFTAIHLAGPGFDGVAVLEMLIGGVVLAVARLRSGSLWLPIGWHFGWNLAEGWLFGCVTSGAAPAVGSLLNLRFSGPTWLTGGTFGPESGLFAFAADSLTLLAYLAFTRSRRDATSATGSSPASGRAPGAAV